VTFGRSGVSAIAIAAGYIHTCVIVTGESVKCWGGNSFGQLGIGHTAQQNSPVDVNMGGMRLFVCRVLSWCIQEHVMHRDACGRTDVGRYFRPCVRVSVRCICP
jgi:alpha-tubulin suppressor-like RCC1 family protein